MPASFGFLRSFSINLHNKTVNFSGIRTGIVGLCDEFADHITITTTLEGGLYIWLKFKYNS